MIARVKSSLSSPSVRAAASMPWISGTRGSSRPITPVDATPTWSGSIPRASAAAACAARAVSSPRSPSETLALPAFATIARSSSVRASLLTATGAPTSALEQKRAAETTSARVAHEHADVQAVGLDPGGDARRAEARRQRGRVELGRVRGRFDPARAEEGHGACSRPSASGSPSIRFRSWSACDAAPFQRLSIAANASTRPVAGSTVAKTRAMLVSRTSRTPGRHVGQLDERLAVVEARVYVGDLGGRQLLAGAHVATREQALVERHEVRDERDPELVGAELLLELRAVAVALDLVRVDVLGDRREVRRLGRAAARARHARLRVDDDVLDHVAERREREDRGGRVATGAGDQIGALDLVAVQLRQPVDRPAEQAGRLVRLVVALVARAVQAEVGRQVDDLQPAVQQVLDDRRRRAVRVGDERGVGALATTSGS